MKTVLVLNMGMKSIRSFIFREDGRKLSSFALPLTSAINDQRVEQDAYEWWEKALQVMGKSIREAGLRKLDAITVTASASCLVCLDKDGEPLASVMMVSDKRAQAEAEEISRLPEFAEVKDKTGLAMSSSLLLPKILWVKHHAEEVFQQAAYFFTPNAYLLYRLCGQPVTDCLDAEKYHYSQSEGSYPARLLQALGLAAASLPRAVEVGSRVGVLSEKIASTFALGGGDRCCCLLL